MLDGVKKRWVIIWTNGIKQSRRTYKHEHGQELALSMNKRAMRAEAMIWTCREARGSTKKQKDEMRWDATRENDDKGEK
jgi:hypothetical protein